MGELELEHGVLGNYLPEDVNGLSPLNCGRCGAPEIGGHPCPACGFDPRE